MKNSSAPFFLWGLLLALSVSASAADTKATAPAAPGGRLEIRGKFIQSLELESREGARRTIDRPSGTLTLPAGEYRLCRAGLQGGYSWQLRGDEEPWFRLEAGKVQSIEVGAPLQPHVAVSPNGGHLSLDYSVRDSAGRKFTGPRLGAPPRYSITKDGQEVGSGSFEYG